MLEEKVAKLVDKRGVADMEKFTQLINENPDKEGDIMDILEDRQGEGGFVIVNTGDHYKPGFEHKLKATLANVVNKFKKRKDIRGSELSDTKVEGGGEQKR